MIASIIPHPGLTVIGRSRLKIGSSLLALVILITGSIHVANGQIPGFQ